MAAVEAKPEATDREPELPLGRKRPFDRPRSLPPSARARAAETRSP